MHMIRLQVTWAACSPVASTSLGFSHLTITKYKMTEWYLYLGCLADPFVQSVLQPSPHRRCNQPHVDIYGSYNGNSQFIESGELGWDDLLRDPSTLGLSSAVQNSPIYSDGYRNTHAHTHAKMFRQINGQIRAQKHTLTHSPSLIPHIL